MRGLALPFYGNFARDDKLLASGCWSTLREGIQPSHPAPLSLRRPVLCRGGRFNDAALLPVRRHGEHRLEDGVDRGSVANPSEPGDDGSIDAGRRIPHRIPRTHRRQGQRQDADLLAARQAGLRQGAAETAAPRVSCERIFQIPTPPLLPLVRRFILERVKSRPDSTLLSSIYYYEDAASFTFDTRGGATPLLLFFRLECGSRAGAI